jgi:hypothetical protein
MFSPGPTVYICPAWAAVHRGVRWANYGVTRVRWGPGNPVRHSPTPGGGGVGKGGHGCQDNIHRDNRHWLAGYRSGSAGSFLVVLFLILNNSGTKIEDADWFQDYISTPLPSPERNWKLKQKVLFYFDKIVHLFAWIFPRCSMVQSSRYYLVPELYLVNPHVEKVSSDNF